MTRPTVGFIFVGLLGLLGFLADAIVENFPTSLLFVAFVLCIVSMYGIIILRGRKRGEDVIDSLSISYGARLTPFERVFMVLFGASILTLALWGPITGADWALGAVGLAVVGFGITGRPPFTAARREERDDASR